MANKETVSRRTFLQGAAAGTLVFALAAHAEEKSGESTTSAGPPVNCAVIGTSTRGREILQALSLVPGANVAVICDTYAATLNGAQRYAPKAEKAEDYRRVLDRKEVAAVFVATPSHLHREVVVNALQAGKHVYCEAPLAVTIDDARAMAQAARGAKSVFQVGQQLRSNPLYHHALTFVKAGALGRVAQARAQWHRKDSWRKAGATPERDRALNWRLYKETSAGLIGEVGIHQIDTVSVALRALPLSAQGFGGILQWRDDDRSVPDTVQCVIEYPGGVRLVYDATLANSFDGAYELMMGSDSAILLREKKAWMFKEADAPQLGWEVYAHRDKLGNEMGIALIANASKLLAQNKMPGKDEEVVLEKDALYYAVEEFIRCIREQKQPACGAREGYEAAVVAVKANEAVMSGTKVTYQKEWFDV
ncbi:MAG: Gfo/Idh/MocA family oxidoreductase [Armatimonadota bacterium]|nr:Gfo/Idh/MocA family oxidoreductase [Armatimonadota bacterium]